MYFFSRWKTCTEYVNYLLSPHQCCITAPYELEHCFVLTGLFGFSCQSYRLPQAIWGQTLNFKPVDSRKKKVSIQRENNILGGKQYNFQKKNTLVFKKTSCYVLRKSHEKEFNDFKRINSQFYERNCALRTHLLCHMF